MIEEHIPCSKFDCTFFTKFVADTTTSLQFTTMPHVFQSSRVCLACIYFRKFDLYEKEKS